MLTPETPYLRSRPFRQLRMLVCILAAASVGACASAGRPEWPSRPAASRIVVRNYSLSEVTLYLVRGGGQWRLGQVDSFGDASFPAPPTLANVEEVHFVARPVGGRPFRSESFVFPTGATAVWTIENQVAMSHVSLR